MKNHQSQKRSLAALTVMAFVALGLLGALVALTPTASAATNCSNDSSDISVSARPRSIPAFGLATGPLVASSIVSPFGDENKCQDPCPSKPAVSGWARPGSLGTSGQLAHANYCRLPPELFGPTAQVTVDVYGDGTIVLGGIPPA